MAKKFAGFKPETMEKKILPALGYNGPNDQKSINQFLAANPAAAAKMGKYTMAARQMVEGKAVGAMNTGGMPSGAALTKQIGTDPTKPVTKAATVANAGGPNTQIAAGAGQAPAAQAATPQAATPAAAAQAPAATPAAQMAAQQAQPAVAAQVQTAAAAQGQVGQQAQVQAAQANPNQAASLGLQAAQQQGAQQIQAPTPMQMTAGQTISGSTVNQSQVDATLAKSEAASVKDELDDLMQDFQGGKTPAWAAGAMRAANQAMMARGVGASSMAGMAVVQAAMESALPIAQMDASNKQQMAMAKAEQRAA